VAVSENWNIVEDETTVLLKKEYPLVYQFFSKMKNGVFFKCGLQHIIMIHRFCCLQIVKGISELFQPHEKPI
jgi:hypothetical protein